MKYKLQAAVRCQRTAGQIVVLALLLMMISDLAMAQNESKSLVNHPLAETHQADQQTDKERKEAEKHAKQQAKEEERQRKEAEKRAKQLTFTPITNIPDGKALVYIYKPKTYGKEKFRVEANGEPVTILEKGGYYPYLVTPGTVVFTAKAKARIGNVFAPALIPKSALTLSVEPGKVYYIKEPGGFKLTVKLDLVQVPTDTAEKEIQKCKLLPQYKP
jgi:hypothetical protein